MEWQKKSSIYNLKSFNMIDERIDLVETSL